MKYLRNELGNTSIYNIIDILEEITYLEDRYKNDSYMSKLVSRAGETIEELEQAIELIIDFNFNHREEEGI